SSVRRIVSILAGSLVLTGVAAHPPQSARAPENAASALIGATVINGTSGPLMSDAIAQMLPAAVGVAISPMPIVAVLLMLVTARGRVNGPAFFMGWWLGISVVGALVFLSAGEIDAAGGGVPLPMAGALELNLGVFLLLMALRQWRGRPHAGEEPAPPQGAAPPRPPPAAGGGWRPRAPVRGQPEEPAARLRRRRRDRAGRHLRWPADHRIRALRPYRLARCRRAGRALLRARREIPT